MPKLQHWAFIAAFAPLVVAQDWALWSPRAEIAPRSSRGDAGELVLEGGGNAAVFGGWERVFINVEARHWYRMKARYRATGLTYEPFQILARLDWSNASGARAGQPDYASRVETDGDWRTISLDAPAPEAASSVKLQLFLQNAPAATVRWKDATLEPIAAPAPRKVTIAAVRYRPPMGNDPIGRFLDLIEAQTPRNTDLILLPEGATLVSTGKTFAGVAEPIPGPTTRRLAEAAKKHHAWLAAGVVERDGVAIYNSSVLIDREGRLAGKYRKVYLPREEIEAGVTPGSEFPVFQTDFGKVGMMICWDVEYADPARALALRGAELILMPIWGGFETLAAARALENHVFVASSGYDFPAMILDPDGHAVSRSESEGTMATATIDLNRRYADPWLGEMRGRFFRELRPDLPADPPGRK